MRDATADAETIFRAGLARVDPVLLMDRVLARDGDRLCVGTETDRVTYDLSRYRRILVLGAGKASARMALGLERILGERLWGGRVAVKEGYRESLSRIELLEAAHPVPDARSLVAARQVLELAHDAGPDDLVIVLLSGGGSAILAAPLAVPGYPLTLADKQATTRVLLACGATIHAVNTVRKKLSAIKGGRLAAAIAPAHCLNLILSDVVGDDLDSIASGPTVPDTTPAVALPALLDRYALAGRIPPAAEALLRDVARGVVPDTPQADDPAFARVRTVLVGTNYHALLAARDEAVALGYDTRILTSQLTGEAREMAHLFVGLARDVTKHGLPVSAPACLLVGGETTVTLRGAGKGGRNQEMALAFLDAASQEGWDIGRTVFLAASTDGGDGPTDAAGAFASRAVLERGRSGGLEPARFLAENDAYHYFQAVNGLLVTGPTNTNVCDIQVLLTPGPARPTDDDQGTALDSSRQGK